MALAGRVKPSPKFVLALLECAAGHEVTATCFLQVTADGLAGVYHDVPAEVGGEVLLPVYGCQGHLELLPEDVGGKDVRSHRRNGDGRIVTQPQKLGAGRGPIEVGWCAHVG